MKFSLQVILNDILMQTQCADIQMVDIEALPEEHPAMCAANNETLIPMPDEYLQI